MAGGGLNWLGVAEQARVIRRREPTPVEILQDTLDWLDRIDDVTHAWVTIRPEEALLEAKAAERALLSGDDRGPLHGLAFSVKDVIGVKGMPGIAAVLVVAAVVCCVACLAGDIIQDLKVGHLIGVTNVAVSKYERGLVTPDGERLVGLRVAATP